MAFLDPGEILAQAIGEYGRIVGGVGQRQSSVSPESFERHHPRMVKAKQLSEGIEGAVGRPVPSVLLLHQDRLCSTRGKMMRQKR